MSRIVRRGLIVVGVIAAGVLLWPRSAHRGIATAPVVIAQRDLPDGKSIDRMALAVAEWPVGTIPPGAFTSVDAVAGQVARVAVFKGEALVPGRLVREGARLGAQVGITPGMRAFAFRVNDVSGIASLIQPNSRVDLIVVVDGGEKGRVATVLMENVRVLAIGGAPQRSPDGLAVDVAVCTVEVTPEEGERLAVATTRRPIQLMLRGYGDSESAKAPSRPTARLTPRNPTN